MLSRRSLVAESTAHVWLRKVPRVRRALAQVVPDALPARLAAALLKELLQDSLTYRRGKWRIFQELKDTPRTNCHYILDDQVCTSRFAACCISHTSQFSTQTGSLCLGTEQAVESAGECAEDLHSARAAPAALREAANCVNCLVQQRQVCGCRCCYIYGRGRAILTVTA